MLKSVSFYCLCAWFSWADLSFSSPFCAATREMSDEKAPAGDVEMKETKERCTLNQSELDRAFVQMEEKDVASIVTSILETTRATATDAATTVGR